METTAGPYTAAGAGLIVHYMWEEIRTSTPYDNLDPKHTYTPLLDVYFSVVIAEVQSLSSHITSGLVLRGCFFLKGRVSCELPWNRGSYEAGNVEQEKECQVDNGLLLPSSRSLFNISRIVRGSSSHFSENDQGS